MKPDNAVWMGVGVIAGMALVFYQTDAPKADACTTYKVAKKSAVSYVLMPPAIEHCEIKSAEPMVQAQNVIAEPTPQVTKLPEIESKSESTNADETPHRRRHRHMRRRHWRDY